MDGELDHLVDQAVSCAVRESVTIEEEPKLSCAHVSTAETISLGYVIVVELGIQPGRMGEVPSQVHRSGILPIDEGDGETVPGDDVPRAKITVTDHRLGTRQISAEPGPPFGVFGGDECRHRFVQLPKKTTDLKYPVVGPRVRLRRLSGHKAQGLPSVVGKAIAENSRGTREADLFKVTEE
jgi:hypothetical protein